MNQLLLNLVVTLAGGGMAATVVTKFFDRRRTAAESGSLDAQAAESYDRIARDQVNRLNTEISDLRHQVQQLKDENAGIERKLGGFERREMQHRDLLQTHVWWDWRVMHLLRERLTPAELEAEQIHPPPPLYPPTG